MDCILSRRSLTQAKTNSQQARDILALYDRLKISLPELTHSQFSLATLETIFSFPIFSQPNFISHSKIPKVTASRILHLLVNDSILQFARKGKGRRAAIFVFLNCWKSLIDKMLTFDIYFVFHECNINELMFHILSFMKH